MAQLIEQTKLFYTEGSSDKVYETWIERVPGEELFKVNFQYGRRGSTLKPGTKTAAPVALDSARKIYEKLVKSKMADGYTPCESGQVYAGSEKAGQVSGLQPMLLNPVDESEADVLCSNDAWVMQEKYDGERQMARLTLKDQSFSMSNRKGLICTHTQALHDQVVALAALMNVTEGEVVLDGERIGEQFQTGHCFNPCTWANAPTSMRKTVAQAN